MSGEVEGWKPPPRPGWVARLNQLGRNVGSPDVLVPLDEHSLLGAATTATGLEDFGPDEWREPFRLLLADIEDQSELTLTGRVMARFDLVKSLVARLRLAEAERQHPEILERPVVAPILITGLGRTGTTILHELLAQDPALRAPLGWELRYPAVPADLGIEMATADIDFWVDVVPEFLTMHESSAEGPDEDTAGLFHEFTSAAWSALHRAPNFDAFIAGAGAQTTRFHKRLLQHFQWRTPGRWVTKNPTQLSALPDVFAEYPDVRIIHTHRDPLKVLASTADMIATLRWQRAARNDYDEYAQMIGFGYPFLLDHVISQRQSGAVPDDRITDVRYADLMTEPVETVRLAYEQLDMELTDAAADRMRARLAARPKGRHGDRRYRFEHLGLDEGDLREKFAAYMQHYDVPREEL